MGLFLKLMMFLVVLGLAAPFVLKGPDGKPLMSLDKIVMPKTPEIPDSVKNLAEELPDIENPMEEKKAPTKVYSWRDENGVMQFSNTPPPSSTQSVAVKQYNPDSNVVKMEQPPVVEEPESATLSEGGKGSGKSGKGADRESTDGLQDIGSLYSREGVEKLMNDAKSLEGKMQQRYDGL